MITDPWTVPESSRPAAAAVATTNATVTAAFEDNFQPLATTCASSVLANDDDDDNDNNILPDSKEYLASLERKLNKLRSDSGVLQQLSARREHCVESLILGRIDLPTAAEFGFDPLDETSEQPAGVVGDLVRHLKPEQAVNAAELLHLIQYDQLQPQPVVCEPEEPQEAEPIINTGAADNVSR